MQHMQDIPLNIGIKDSSKYPSLSLLLEKSLQGALEEVILITVSSVIGMNIMFKNVVLQCKLDFTGIDFEFS